MAQYDLNLLDYWLIIKKRRWTILIAAGLVLALTFALTEVIKPKAVYEAAARVKFDRTSTVASLLLESMSYQAWNDVATQSEVIRSFPVMERVAAELGIVPPRANRDHPHTTLEMQAIYDLQKHFKATQEGNTNIIKITAKGDSAQLAARLANAVAQAYRLENIHARNRIVMEARRFVEEQLAALEVQLSDAEEALREFKEREGQVFVTEEARAALEAFTKLEADLNAVRRLRDETQKQIRLLRTRDFAVGRDDLALVSDEPSALLTVLKTRLVDLDQERSGLLVGYTAEHPKVKEVDRKIATVKSQMLGELESKVASLLDRETLLEQQMAGYRERYLNFPKAAIELSRLEREVKVNADLYAGLKTRHQELLIKSAEQIEEVTIIEPAVPPTTPVNDPNTPLNALAGTLMGLFVGVVLAFMRESFDTSIGTIEGVEEYLKVPVLGVIPQFDEKEQRTLAAKELPADVSQETLTVFSRLVSLYDAKSILSEGFRSLRTNMQFAGLDRGTKTVMFTSAGLGEGKTFTVVNLAITLAQDGKRVLLVDADLRRPVVHARLGFPREPGLAEALMGGANWRQSVRTVTDLMLGKLGVDRILNTHGLDNLNVLTSGLVPPHPAEFLNSVRLEALLAEMREEYEVILFDTPPILPIADAIMLSAKVDGVVLVYQVGRIGRNALKRAKFLLEHAQARVLGVVLTNVRAEITPEYGYYRYDYR